MRLTRLRTLTLSLAFGGLLASAAQASPISTPIAYDTSGFVGAIGDPAGPVTFKGVSGQHEFLVPGSFNLGHFTTPALPSTGSLTYNDTPFTIDAFIAQTPGQNFPKTEVEFVGRLDGTLTGSSSSSLTATVTSIHQVGMGTLPFPIGNISVSPQVLLPGGNRTDLVAFVSSGTSNIPEPSSIVLFGTVLAGFGLRRWRRSGS